MVIGVKSLNSQSIKPLRSASWLGLLAASWLISGCAYLGGGSAKPEVHLTGLRPLATQGLEARFMVGLKIVNSGGRGIRVSGLSYRLKLNGHSLISGVSAGIGNIPAHSEKRVEVEASTNLLTSFKALSDVLKNPDRSHAYELETKIKTPWWPIPITVLESGLVDLGE